MMKILSILFLTFVLFPAPFARADDAKPSVNEKNAQVSEKEEHEKADQNPNYDSSKDLKENLDQGLHLQKKPSTDHSNEVTGNCEIVKSDSSPIVDPCVSTQLILKDMKGKEVARTRTDDKGRFAFIANPKQRFKISAQSAAYDVVAPAGPVNAGANVQVKLRLH